MKSKILILLIPMINLFAIDINDAIGLAIENNYNLKKQTFIQKESKSNLDSFKGTFHPKLDINYNYQDRDNPTSSQTDQYSKVEAKLSYNLFKGFSDIYTLDSYKNLLSVSKYQLNAFKNDLILDVKTLYIDYLLKEKETKTQYEALKLYEQQYKDTNNMYTQGFVSRNELLEVEVEMLQSKQLYEKAKTKQSIVKKSLNNLLGGVLAKEEKITELKQESELTQQFDDTLLENRSEIKALKELILNYQNQAKAINGKFYPKVDLELSHSKHGDKTIPNNTAFYKEPQTIAGVNISWNLYNGGSDRYKKVALIDKLNQYKMELEDTRLKITLQYEEAMDNFNVAKLNLITATKALEQAKENYQIIKNKVKEGIEKNTELIDANYLLTKAKQNYFSAYYKRYISIATIDRVFEYIK